MRRHEGGMAGLDKTPSFSLRALTSTAAEEVVSTFLFNYRAGSRKVEAAC